MNELAIYMLDIMFLQEKQICMLRSQSSSCLDRMLFLYNGNFLSYAEEILATDVKIEMPGNDGSRII